MISSRRRSSFRPIPAIQIPVSVVLAPGLLSGATEGQPVSAQSGQYAGSSPITIARQWQISDTGTSGWSDSVGETALIRSALTALEVNKYIRMREIASNPLGDSTPQYTTVIQVAASNPPGSGVATLTFTPAVGVTDYEVAWGPVYDSEAFSNQYASVSGTITVTGLQAGTLYFKIRSLPGGDWYSLGPVVIA